MQQQYICNNLKIGKQIWNMDLYNCIQEYKYKQEDKKHIYDQFAQ